jgi:hypothetical protein
MNEFSTTSNLPPAVRRGFVLEAERASLTREISELKEEMKAHARRFVGIAGLAILVFGISKWIWPDVSIYLFLFWTVGILYEGVQFARCLVAAQKKLRTWNQIMKDSESVSPLPKR